MINKLSKKSILLEITRKIHKIPISKLVYREYGDPSKVLQHQKDHLEYELGANQVLVKMLAAPISPQDMSTIQGKYPIRPTLPSVPGNEGVGDVEQIGDKITTLSIGDRVVPLKSQLGTWCTHFLTSPEHLLKVPKNLGLVESATMTIDPCTAYRLLHDFIPLHPGDSLIQNGATSSVGQNIIQLARVMKVTTVNVVRTQEHIDELKQYLKDLGADFILTEDELQQSNIFNIEVKRPTLGLNCIGGKSCLQIIGVLDKNAVLVTYGGMDREHVVIPAAPLIYRKLRAVGFWLQEWLDENENSIERQEMYDNIVQLMVSGELKGPSSRIIPFNQYKEAVKDMFDDRGMLGRKYILNFR